MFGRGQSQGGVRWGTRLRIWPPVEFENDFGEREPDAESSREGSGGVPVYEFGRPVYVHTKTKKVGHDMVTDVVPHLPTTRERECCGSI